MKSKITKSNVYVLLCTLFLTFGLRTDVQAQQDAQFTQYMFNPLVINPAYAGSREVLSAIVLYRDQWVNFEGAPTTGTFSINSPLRNPKVGVGLHIINDVIGPNRNTGVLGSYAYRLPLTKGKICLGLRAGAYQYTQDLSKITYYEADKFYGQNKVWAPTFDFGTYYYTKKFYAGACASHINQAQLTLSDSSGTGKRRIVSHFVANAGYAFVMSKQLTFRPSMVIKSTLRTAPNVDVNAAFLLQEKLWIGVGMRLSVNKQILNSGIAMIEYSINKKFRLGYSYDISLNELITVNQGSHELFLGFDFELFKSKTLSPRYF